MTETGRQNSRLAMELSASIGETENAVNAILDAVDRIAHFMSIDGEASVGDHILSECTRIREACTFQDIVGQRLVKVASALRAAIRKSGVTGSEVSPRSKRHLKCSPDPDSCKLDGPALSGEGLSQDDIERMWEKLSV